MRSGVNGAHGWPHPPVPVQSGRNGLGCLRFTGGPGWAANLHLLQFADVSVADQLATEQHLAIVSLLSAMLKDDLMLADSAHDRLSLRDGARQRLLAVDVFASSRRRDGNQGVPMVRGRNINGIHIRPGQDLAKVVVGAAVFVLVMGVDDRFASLAAFLANVGIRPELHVRSAQGISQPKPRPIAATPIRWLGGVWPDWPRR